MLTFSFQLNSACREHALSISQELTIINDIIKSINYCEFVMIPACRLLFDERYDI